MAVRVGDAHDFGDAAADTASDIRVGRDGVPRTTGAGGRTRWAVCPGDPMGTTRSAVRPPAARAGAPAPGLSAWHSSWSNTRACWSPCCASWASCAAASAALPPGTSPASAYSPCSACRRATNWSLVWMASSCCSWWFCTCCWCCSRASSWCCWLYTSWACASPPACCGDSGMIREGWPARTHALVPRVSASCPSVPASETRLLTPPKSVDPAALAWATASVSASDVRALLTSRVGFMAAYCATSDAVTSPPLFVLGQDRAKMISSESESESLYSMKVFFTLRPLRQVPGVVGWCSGARGGVMGSEVMVGLAVLSLEHLRRKCRRDVAASLLCDAVTPGTT
mmetsp:Transcript_9515/g.24248  ORF Transcript_9515/g.24248 Transcript_9515/m.24248 type:complete len:341 (-) Transcript_9515:118-1140(-)